MAIILETGTGLPNANSYASIAEADAYFSDTSPEWMAMAFPEKTKALILATKYIDGRYRTRFDGSKAGFHQSLQWPRASAANVEGQPLTGVPREVKEATMEAAMLVLGGEDLTPKLERGGKVDSETVGPITTAFSAGAPVLTSYPAVDRVIAMALKPARIGLTVVR